MQYVADLAPTYAAHHLDKGGRVPTVEPDRQRYACLAASGYRFLSRCASERERLFDVHMLVGAGCGHDVIAMQRMWSCDDHRINGTVLQHCIVGCDDRDAGLGGKLGMPRRVARYPFDDPNLAA